ncbi:hypothetical protein [Salinisphaera sp. G21_0]|uniref:hypothetical protein n=1 Tax=Salinisphaera sp. G21_0 TaxID=2821094 RepID=UPI001ADD22C7|nr:hypothetical protein [Salinisphaera sp. G21_0]MBO9481255.1 hypothetical protein [Salinisphaera sp. G21_0]
MPSSIGAPAPQVIVVEPHKRDWTIVRWCHKVADSVSRKFDEGSTFGKWLGRAVAAVFVPFGILPSLVGDAIHGIRGKDLSDRRVETTQAVEKKIPTMEEFAALKAEKEALKAEKEALKTDKEALLKRVSAAEADAKQAKLENEDLNIRAESQADALLRNAEEEKKKLLENAQNKFLTERKSKVRCIRKQHEELEELKAKGMELKRQADKLDAQEKRLAALNVDVENFKAVAIHHKNKAETFKKIAVDNFTAAFTASTNSFNVKEELKKEQEATLSLTEELKKAQEANDSLTEELKKEDEATRFMAERMLKEQEKTWQEKFLNKLFEGFSVKIDLEDLEPNENLVRREDLNYINKTVKLEKNEDGKEPIFKLSVQVPGAVKRVVSLNLSQLNILLERLEQFDAERKDLGIGLRRVFEDLKSEEFNSFFDDNDGELLFDCFVPPSYHPGQSPESFFSSVDYNGPVKQTEAEVSDDKQGSESVKTNTNGEEVE